MQEGVVEVYTRRNGEKKMLPLDEMLTYLDKSLYKMQNDIIKKHAAFSQEHTFVVDSYDDFKTKIEQGFVLAHWDGTTETAEKIQEETGASIRCIPFIGPDILQCKSEKDFGCPNSHLPLADIAQKGKCILTGAPSTQRVVFARAY